MGIRETLNKNQGITIGVTGAIIAISLFFIVRHLLSGGGPKIPPAPTKAYFALDEGGLFADDIKLVAPYEKDGKTAFRAHVFKCKDSEQQFLGYLSCFSPEAKKVLLTPYADTEAAIRAINDIRLDHYLMKPWDPPEER